LEYWASTGRVRNIQPVVDSTARIKGPRHKSEQRFIKI
jgi:hypothetical protein